MKKVNNAGTVNHTAQKDTGCSSILSKKSMPSGNKKSKRLKEKEIENINIPCFRAIEGTAFIVTTPSRNIGILREASNINKVNLPDVEIVYIYNGSEIIFYFGFKNNVMIKNPLVLKGEALGLPSGCTDKDRILKAIQESPDILDELYWGDIIEKYLLDQVCEYMGY